MSGLILRMPYATWLWHLKGKFTETTKLPPQESSERRVRSVDEVVRLRYDDEREEYERTLSELVLTWALIVVILMGMGVMAIIDLVRFKR